MRVLAVIEAVLGQRQPGHDISFWSLVPYLVDPTPDYVVRIETLAGICKATLTDLTPDSTIRRLQCAYRADQLARYLTSRSVAIPPTFRQTVAAALHKHGYVPPPNLWTKIFGNEAPDLVAVIKDAPTDFSDTFAIQLCVQDGSYKHILLSDILLSTLGLASKRPITLTVTIRPDCAELNTDLDMLTIRDSILTDHLAYQQLNDRTLVYEMVKQNGDALEYASDELRADREIVLVAVQNDGGALTWTFDELRADREVVMAAVENNGDALYYASYELRADREIVIAAVENTGDALYYASYDLRADREIVLVAVENDGDALRWAFDKLRADRKVVLVAVENDGDALKYASPELRADREIVLAAVENDGGALEYASAELKSDRDIVMVAVQNDGEAFEYASGEMRADPDIYAIAFEND